MKNIFVILASLTILSGCKKSIDALPDATQAGANTFGLKLNGQFWVPQSFAGINAPILHAELSGSNLDEIKITAQNFASEPTESQFTLFVKGITGPGTYPLNQTTDISSNSSSYGYYVKRKINPVNEWMTSSENTGTVTITKWDKTDGIVSGTFEFNAGSLDSSSNAITVTDGRFDVKLQ
ncbi:MAG TPA: DUF6252 family protein [Flavisolibacter sp.]